MTSTKKNILFFEMGVEEQDKKLLEPLTYVNQVSGKNIRAKFLRAMNHWMNVPTEKLKIITEMTQRLHDSSLPIDDIQDNSDLRRGIPVAHIMYGMGRTLRAANYNLIMGQELILSLNNPKSTRVFSEQISELFRGQGLDVYWRDTYTCPTEDEYRNVAKQKTGALFLMSVQLMQLYSDCKEEFSYFVGIITLYYQIRDDYCNLRMYKDYCANKDYCEDLTEGKFGFPVIHAIRSRPEDKRIMDILRLRTNDVNVKQECVNLLEEFGSFAYTRSVMKELDQSARDEIERLGGNPIFTAMLDELLDWTKIEENNVLSGKSRNL